MVILVDLNICLCVLGIIGCEGMFYSLCNCDYGIFVVVGVMLGKGG